VCGRGGGDKSKKLKFVVIMSKAWCTPSYNYKTCLRAEPPAKGSGGSKGDMGAEPQAFGDFLRKNAFLSIFRLKVLHKMFS